MLTWQDIRRVLIFTTVAFASNFEYGFSTTFLNTPVDEFKDYINESYIKHFDHEISEGTYNVLWNLILNIWFVGFFFGIWLSPIINDRFGRKFGYICGNGIVFLSSIIRFLAIILNVPILLIVARFITSMCIAVTYQACILYLQESSPTRLRGQMTFLSEISFAVMCVVGMLLGTNEMLGQRLAIFMAFPIPFCCFFFIVSFFLPETPKYLLIVKRDKEAAQRSVEFYHGKDADVDEALREIILEAEDEKANVGISFKHIVHVFKQKHLRTAVLLSCSALQNTVALWSILLSSTYFLRQVNLDDNLAAWSSTVMTVAYVLGTLLGSSLIERLGRRALLLTFTTLNNTFLVLFVVFDECHPYADGLKYGCLVCLILYGFTYGAGVGPISWFISSELVPQKYRSLVQSLCYGINTIMVVISTFSILPLYSVIGSYAFLALYTGPSVCCIVFLFKCLPETRGREIHAIVRQLRGGKDVAIDDDESTESEDSSSNDSCEKDSISKESIDKDFTDKI